MNSEFAGRSAIVTGGSSGIGFAIAKMLVERGASVVLVARDPSRLEFAAKDIGGQVATVAGDAALKETAERAVSAALALSGKLDVLLNIAGWYPTVMVEHTSDDDYAATLAANLTATFAMCRAALPALREIRRSYRQHVLHCGKVSHARSCCLQREQGGHRGFYPGTRGRGGSGSSGQCGLRRSHHD